eukprot:9110906-Karenia_brevis.AAC.1
MAPLCFHDTQDSSGSISNCVIYLPDTCIANVIKEDLFRIHGQKKLPARDRGHGQSDLEA